MFDFLIVGGIGGSLLLAAKILREPFIGLVQEWRTLANSRLSENERLSERLAKVESALVETQSELMACKQAERKCRQDYTDLAEKLSEVLGRLIKLESGNV